MLSLLNKGTTVRKRSADIMKLLRSDIIERDVEKFLGRPGQVWEPT